MKLDRSWQRYEAGWPEVRGRYDMTVRLVRGPAVLDVGCGQGLLLHLLRERPDIMRRVGLDCQPEIIYDANSRLADNYELWLEDAEHNPGLDAEFDTVVLGQVLEHVDDAQAAVTEALRVLKPGGRLIVNVPIEAEPHGVHVRAFPTINDMLALFGDAIDWTDAGKVYDYWYAWGDRR